MKALNQPKLLIIDQVVISASISWRRHALPDHLQPLREKRKRNAPDEAR
jgi:hypothetical protein